MSQPKPNRRPVDPETFVREWQKAKSVGEFCKRIGMNPNAASVRAGYFRKKGVPLKKGSHGGPKLDIPALAKLARSIKP